MPFLLSQDGTVYLVGRAYSNLEIFAIPTGKRVASFAVRQSLRTASNIFDGVVDGSHILISGMDIGSRVLSIDGNEIVPEWESGDFQVDMSPFVFVGGYLYGFDSIGARVRNGLVCIDAFSGKEIWREELKMHPDLPTLLYGGG